MGYGEFWFGHTLTDRTVSYGLGQTIKIIGKYILLCNSFVLSRIEFMIAMEVSWDDRPQPHTLLL